MMIASVFPLIIILVLCTHIGSKVRRGASPFFKFSLGWDVKLRGDPSRCMVVNGEW